MFSRFCLVIFRLFLDFIISLRKRYIIKKKSEKMHKNNGISHIK